MKGKKEKPQYDKQQVPETIVSGSSIGELHREIDRIIDENNKLMAEIREKREKLNRI